MQSVLFRKSLLDLVKGLRSAKNDESAFINKCLAEIKAEVRDVDHDSKANALQKLCFLYMLGYDVSFALFHVVECMSQPSFMHRRTAYLLASLAFTESTDVIMLTPHLFKKAFAPQSAGSDPRLMDGLKYETGAALNCLANICTDDLAQSLLEDIHGMLNSSKPYLRKKAVLTLFPIFKVYPRALVLTFDRLKAKLKDDDPGVQNAAVNVICELARKNPSNYLPLLPQLFELLNNSSNNWMLIKLVKLLGSLIPAEPRLARKLQDPLTHIISNTPAKSLLYECINTATASEVMPKSLVRLCLDKLRTFVEDLDQNLKYLGLLGLNRIMKQNVKAVAAHRDLIIQCLEDPDVTIRMRALDLIVSMVNEKNLESIIRKLTEHMYGTDGSYRDHVLEQVILVCAKNDYEYVSDFGWYVQLLTNMTHLSSMCHRNAELIANQLLDVTVRVPEVREFSVQLMEELIVNNGLIGDSLNMSSNAICRVLRAAAYIVGEFAEYVDNHLTLSRAMLQSRISSLPGDIQCFFVHNALKVVCMGLTEYLASDEDDSEDEDEEEEDQMQKARDLVSGSTQLLEPLGGSPHIEVQERATAYLYFFKWLLPELENLEESSRAEIANAFASMFSAELMPVLPKHQLLAAKKIPDGLVLDAWIGEPWPEKDSDDEEPDMDVDELDDIDKWYSDDSDKDREDMDDSWDLADAGKPSKKDRKAAKKRAQEREKARKTGPYYLFGSGEQDSDRRRDLTEDDITQIPTETKNDVLNVTVMPRKNKKRGKKTYTVRGRTKMKGEGKKGKKKGDTIVEDIDLNGIVDPLALDLDALKGDDLSMPSVGVYTRTDAYSESKKERNAPQNEPEPESQPAEPIPSKKRTKGDRKSKSKKAASKAAKKKGGKKKGGKSKKSSAVSAVNDDAAEPADKPTEEEKTQQIDDGSLFGFLGIDESNTTQSEPKSSPSKKSRKKGGRSAESRSTDEVAVPSAAAAAAPPSGGGGFDIFGFLDDVGGSAPPPAATEVQSSEPAASKKKGGSSSSSSAAASSASRKSGSSSSSAGGSTLFSDGSVRVSYLAKPLLKKKGALCVKFTVSNRTDSVLKNAKIQVNSNSHLKHKSKKEKESLTLAKSLGAGQMSDSVDLIFRCTLLSGVEVLQCRLKYSCADGSSADEKLNLRLAPQMFAKLSSECAVKSEDSLSDLVENSDECSESSVIKLKLNKSVSIDNAVDDFVNVFRLKQISRDSKKASFFGDFISGHSLAVLLKMSSSKHALHATVRTFSQEFAESFTAELKAHFSG